MRRGRALRIVALLSAGLPGAGMAAAQSCAVSATGLSFGAYQPLLNAQAQSTATVTLSCSGGAGAWLSYGIRLGAGGAGSFADRFMTGPGGRLAYQLYLDPAYSRVWGDGTQGTAVNGSTVLLRRLPTTQRHIVYGRIPPNQHVGAGAYVDTMLVMLSF